MPKGYQISQLDSPIVEGGFLQIEIDGEKQKKIGITRAHLEEDTGKLIYSVKKKYDIGFTVHAPELFFGDHNLHQYEKCI